MIFNLNKSAQLSFVFFTLVAALTISSCKTAKKIQASVAKKDTVSVHITNSILVVKKALEQVHKTENDFKTFSAKMKVEYQDSKGKQPNITAYVRILKDSLIWISGYATVFNIEAFRILINKDSVFVLDKINKQVQYRSMDYLQEVTQIPFDFTTLQNLLIGNPVFLEDSVVSYKETESKILLATLGKFFKNLLTVDKSNHLLVHSKLDDVDINRNRTADITYSNFENNNGINFSTYREIIVSEKNKLNIELNFKQWEFNKDLSIIFSIPKNYKRR
jgi:outer membrane lipoprotein-sorting protein